MHFPHWQSVQVQELDKFPRSNGYPPSALATKGWGGLCIYTIATMSTGEEGIIVEENSTFGWADEGQIAQLMHLVLWRAVRNPWLCLWIRK